AVCTPTRYGILTGRYSFRSRLKSGVLLGYSKPLIGNDRMTVASFLKQQEYNTGCIGKWHLGLDWPVKDKAKKANGTNVDFAGRIAHGPIDLGFDYFFGISASLDMDPYVYIENDRPTAVPDRITPASPSPAFWRKGPIGSDFDFEGVLPKLTEKATEYIDAQAKEGNPFFLYFPMPAPHTPIVPTAEFQGKSGMNPYADFVMQTDDTVGRVMDALERNNLTENTLVIFTSDNGCSPQANFDELAKFGHDPSYVFRGYKADIYEGGHHIPFIAAWPSRIKPNTTSDQTICLTDLFATAADILDVPVAEAAAVDSVSILGALTGKATGAIREATVHHSINGSFSIRQGKWKLVLCAGSGGWSAPRPGKEAKDAPPMQLFDITKDISERKNLYYENPQVVKQLTTQLKSYIDKGRSTPGARQQNAGKTNILKGIPKARREELPFPL
ncbi:MAG: arylsulfatase, partial [Planctomycetes bacterium]|nr:arylsulfatase [Planctomycetota bacterium]